MNFRTVRTMRRGLRRGESGQAFAELAVSLFLIILPAFVGFLLVAALASDRVSMCIRAREDADRRMFSHELSQNGESIRYWDYGADEIPFTMDDHAVLGSAGDGALFKNQLADNTGHVSLQNPPSSSDPDSWPREDSAFFHLQNDNFFVNAASLVEGSARTSDSLRDHKLSSLEPTIKWLFNIDGTAVEERRVYMPSREDLSDERGD